MPTAADLELIAYAASRDREVNARQLKRWRTLGLMPERKRRSLGRGRGFTSSDKPWARFQVLAVIDTLAQDRSADHALLRLWYSGWDITTTVVRDVIERRVAADRERFADLEAQALAQFGVMSAFGAMELDSEQRPITRAEARRMQPLATSEDTARQLAHGTRLALQAQLLASPDEEIAVDELHAHHYLGLAQLEGVFAALEAPADVALSEVLAGLQTVDQRAVLESPTEAQLNDARWRLRYFAYLQHLLRTADVGEIPGAFVEMFERLTTFDPDDQSFPLEDLITALRVMPAVRPQPVQFSE